MYLTHLKIYPSNTIYWFSLLEDNIFYFFSIEFTNLLQINNNILKHITDI